MECIFKSCDFIRYSYGWCNEMFIFLNQELSSKLYRGLDRYFVPEFNQPVIPVEYPAILLWVRQRNFDFEKY